MTAFNVLAIHSSGFNPHPSPAHWIDIFANARSQHEPMYMHFEDDWRIHKPKILLCIIFPKDLLSHFTHWYIEFPCLESIFIFIQWSIHWYAVTMYPVMYSYFAMCVQLNVMVKEQKRYTYRPYIMNAAAFMLIAYMWPMHAYCIVLCKICDKMYFDEMFTQNCNWMLVLQQLNFRPKFAIFMQSMIAMIDSIRKQIYYKNIAR
jgi:hypothetical protein